MAKAPSLSEQLGAFALDFPDASIPTDVQANAWLHLIDAVGIALLVSRSEYAPSIRAYLAAQPPSAEATVLGLGLRASRHAAAIANGTLALMRHRHEWDRLVADPSLAAGAVDELLRYDGPIQYTGRIAGEDVEIGGVQIAKDDQLILMLCGANRDLKQFADPHTLDINRHPNRHLSFGAGVHRCLGSHLGRIELTIALEELHRRIPDYRLVEGDPPT